MTDPNVPAQPENGDAPLTPPAGGQPEHWQSPTPPQYLPPQAPQAPHAPQASQAPQAPQYGAPQPPQYDAPQYGAPQPTPHVHPQQAPYGQPQQHRYGQQPYTAQQSYGQQPYAAAPNYGTPGPGGYFDGAADPNDLSRPLYGATFGQAVRRFFKSYAKFDGRASRSEFWWVALFTFIVQFVPAFMLMIGVFGAAFSATSYDYYSESSAPSVFAIVMMLLGGLLWLGISLAMIVPTLALGWRRLHDGNFAGPLYLITLAGIIPYIGWLGSVAVLVLAAMPSKVEGRRFDRP